MSEGQDEKIRIVVDRDACETHAVCESLLPEVFEVGDNDVMQILVEEHPASMRPRLQRAVDSCPRAALRIEPVGPSAS